MVIINGDTGINTIQDGTVTSSDLATSIVLTGVPTAPTATVGTNTTQLATTSFAYGAMGNLGGQQAPGASFTLTQANSGKMQVATAAITFTLPPINTIVSGSVFILKAGIGTSTIALNGNGSELSRLTILQGETVALQSDGGSYYRLLYRSSDFSSSLSSFGYSYMPNGLFIQWGAYTPAAANTVYAVNFPIAFPNNVFICLSNPDNNGTTVTTSQCNYASKSQLNLISNTANITLFWIAIGN
jgi:hypothetical protein